MIKSIEPRGKLVHECGVHGETRADDVFPAHPNGIPVSRDKWLLVYATRSWRGVDDDRSIIYQLRQGSPDGKILAEGILAHAVDNWHKHDEQHTFVKQHGQPAVFGVPRGAIRNGESPPHAGIFVVKWRINGRMLNIRENTMSVAPSDPYHGSFHQGVEWLQLCLNDREDDIEIIQPIQWMRQQGYEEGDQFCSAADAGWMNQSLVQALPFNEDATEWVECAHFDGQRIGVLKFAFNRQRGVYKWIATGPLLGGERRPVTEASIVRCDDGWVISARRGDWTQDSGIVWFRCTHPLDECPPPILAVSPPVQAPITTYSCPDGKLRIFSGGRTISPHDNGRNPLYCWDVDPSQNFEVSNQRVVFDGVQAGLPIRPESRICVDMCKLLPHTGGDVQWLAHRVRTASINSVNYTGVAINEAEKNACGIYYARLLYERNQPGLWQFAG